jgi:hypothetical protein
MAPPVEAAQRIPGAAANIEDPERLTTRPAQPPEIPSKHSLDELILAR